MSQRLDHQIRTLRSLFWSPRDPEGRAFAPLAEAYLEAGDPSQALELVVEGLDRHPDFASGHLVAGRVFQATDDLDSALLAFDRVLELDPENTAALLARARISEMQGQLQEAMSRYLRLDALSPGDPQVQEAIRKLEAGEAPTAEPDDVLAGGLDEDFLEQPVVVDEPLETSPDLVPDDDPTPSLARASAEEFTLETLDDESQEPEVLTRTMAELLARQGFKDRALEIYRHLLAEAPGDPELQARVTELAGGDTPDPPPPSEAEESVAEAGEIVVEEGGLVSEAEEFPTEEEPGLQVPGLEPELASDFASDFASDSATDEPVGSADYEIIDLEATEEVEPPEALPPEALPPEVAEEDVAEEEVAEEDDDAAAPLAPQWVSDEVDALADQGSPFPWDPELDDGDEESDSSQEGAEMEPGTPSSPTGMKGRTAGGYLQDLLAWVPGAVPVESLAPASPPPSSDLDMEAPGVPQAAPQLFGDETEAPSRKPEVTLDESEPLSDDPDPPSDDPDPPSDDPDPPSDDPDDDFQSWLEQLRP